MPASPSRRSFPPPRLQAALDMSVDLLRREHPERYREWVLLGSWAATLGYVASCVAIAYGSGMAGLLRAANPYLVLLDLVALALAYGSRSRLAAVLVLGGLFVDMHLSMALDGGKHLIPGGMLAPVFVLGTGMLLGGRMALTTALVGAVTVPLSMVIAASGNPELQTRLLNPLLLVTIIGTLLATGVLLFAFLRTFSQVLLESRNHARLTRELIEDSPDAIIALSLDGRIEAFNRTAEGLLGVERKLALGAPHTDLPLHPEAGSWPSDARRLLEHDEAIALCVGEGPTRLEALARPTTRADGSPGILVVLRDVTQRWKAEARARVLSAQLQQAQKLEAIGLLAGGIAHDFNNLLTAIGGFGSLVLKSHDPKARECAAQIVATQERGAALTRQLLAFARRDVVQPRPLDLGAALEDMAPLVERLVGEGVRLVLEVDGVCPILADPGRFEQVLLNLAANARDAMPSGGTLTLRCSADAREVTLVVEDTGEGIPPELQSRVFEPFFTTKDLRRGTGLGLSTVHGIVADSGGSIGLESEPGRGSRFIIRWPRSAVLPAPPRATKDAEPPRGDGRVLVLCEDHGPTRSYVTRLLGAHGYRVEVAPDGERGLELMRSRVVPPDLLLTDVVMPGLSGPELAWRVRERWPDLPVLFMSGYLGDLRSEPGIDTTRDLVIKPFTGNDLLCRVAAKLAPRGGEATDAQAGENAGSTGP